MKLNPEYLARNFIQIAAGSTENIRKIAARGDLEGIKTYIEFGENMYIPVGRKADERLAGLSRNRSKQWRA